jgi:outer membrane murein-binding lipoprotein Lpp
MRYFIFIIGVLFAIVLGIIAFSSCGKQLTEVKYVDRIVHVPEFIEDSLSIEYVKQLQEEINDCWNYLKDYQDCKALRNRNKELMNEVKNLNSKIKQLERDLRNCNKIQRIDIRRNKAPVTINTAEANDSATVATEIKQDIKSEPEKKKFPFWVILVIGGALSILLYLIFKK